MKQTLQKWALDNKIPGKMQSMLTGSGDNLGDWRIRIEAEGTSRRMELDPPVPDLEPPELVKAIFEQLGKDHLRALRRSMMQGWLRHSKDGLWGMVLQTRIGTPDAGRALKTFLDYLQRFHPSVVCCHSVDTMPYRPFDLAHPPTAMKFDIKGGFGSEFLELGNTGTWFHILDWLPRLRDPWVQWPARLKEFIHPRKGDKLLQLYSGPATESLFLADSFEECHTLDSRIFPRLGVLHTVHARGIRNVHHTMEKASATWVEEFFEDPARKGKWTILLNPPGAEPMDSTLLRTIGITKPERVVHIISRLDVAITEIKRWRRSGYMLRKWIPMVLGPGRQDMEYAFLFVPDRAGVLGDKKAKAYLDDVLVSDDIPRSEAPKLKFVQPPGKGKPSPRS